MKKSIISVAVGCLFFSHAMAGSFVKVVPPDASASADEIELYEARIRALTEFQDELDALTSEEESLYEQCSNGTFRRGRSDYLQERDCGMPEERLDPDFIYIKGVSSDEEAAWLYGVFEEDYVESCYFPSRSRTRPRNGCMVISKASLGESYVLKRVMSEEVDPLHVDTFKIMPIKSSKDSRGGGSVEGSVTLRWGGNEEPSLRGDIKGKVYDKKGNYIVGEIRKDEDGVNEATIGGGYEEKEK